MNLGADNGSIRVFRIATAVLALALLTFACRPADRLCEKPIIEDGFYQLSVARNLAAGHGLTIDGEQWTNGFQPLFTLLCAPAYWLTGGDRLVTLRLVLVLHTIVQLAAAWCLATFVRDLRPGDANAQFRFWLTMVVYLGAPALAMQHHNGLETGLLLLIYVAVGRVYQWAGTDSLTSASLLGIMLGLLTLARIDAAFMACVMAGSQLVATGAWSRRIARFALIGGFSALVSSPWWIYNLTSFGSLMPTSGSAQERWAADPTALVNGVSAVAKVLTPSMFLSRLESGWTITLRLIVVVALAILACKAAFRPKSSERLPLRARRAWWYLGCVVATFVILIPYYLLTSSAPYFWERYFAPLSLVAVVGTVLALTPSAPGKWMNSPTVSAVALCVAVQVLMVATFAYAGRFFAGNVNLTQQLPLVCEHVPSGERVAAFQTGTLGYFREQVVNLDGKVNVAALRNRHNIEGYLDREHIDWYCDSWMFTDDPEIGRRWTEVATKGQFVLYHRVRGTQATYGQPTGERQ